MARPQVYQGFRGTGTRLRILGHGGRLDRRIADTQIGYGTVVFPARPRRPRDKPKVEVAVQVAQRWILARLHNESFFSLAALTTTRPLRFSVVLGDEL